ncbi:MAG TPA: DinB family protein [Pyrinomonadaceae bacterium]
MKRSLFFSGFFLFICLVAPAVAQSTSPLTADERKKAVDYLELTRKKFLDSIKGLSEDQWKFKPAADRWSVAEVAEHIGVSEQTIFGMITGQVMKSVADPSKRDGVKGKEDQILKMIPDRTTRAQAPEILRPTGRWATREALTEEFKKSRAASIEFVKSTKEPLRDHFGPNPVFTELDAWQWLLFMAAHTERHTAQINEVKADPAFPKKKSAY